MEQLVHYMVKTEINIIDKVDTNEINCPLWQTITVVNLVFLGIASDTGLRYNSASRSNNSFNLPGSGKWLWTNSPFISTTVRNRLGREWNRPLIRGPSIFTDKFKSGNGHQPISLNIFNLFATKTQRFTQKNY